jgi:AraC-like DNA-binding protein
VCAHPSEVFAVERIIARGSASALTIDTKTLQDYVAEHEVPAERLRLRAVTRVSDALLARLFDVFTLLRPGPSPMEIQTSLTKFSAALVRELLEDSPAPSSRASVDSRTASRIRDCLHADPSVAIDLSTLAKRIGISRFRILRVFKRRYGLPPHAYQLQLRLGLARRGLREGLRPAEVAAEYGFVDQSHLTRHFKRLVGVTPAQYARVSIKADDRMPPSYPTTT